MKTDTVLDSVSATGNEFQRVGPEYIRFDLNKSNLGMGTLSFLEREREAGRQAGRQAGRLIELHYHEYDH